ncbi:MAG: adenylate/guanylate cyclase domain-containing protein [Deltaproteobacteria bacterium]|nr:adenylate/guanylate cyclase domain-containing protein [Deltaproteobacteria bacterium]
MERDQEKGISSDASKKAGHGVRNTLLLGVFWRILIIEGILLAGTLLYEAATASAEAAHLLWYAVRILSLVAVIILFMMVTLRSFLTRKIISPLEAIVRANRRLQDNDPDARKIPLSGDTPREIKEIVSSRSRMLETIFKISEERLHLVDFIRDTFGRYLSKKVVDEILESPEGQKIGGRREKVTILMSDLRGFTSLSETKDPEEMVLLLNRYLERMSKVILGYDGMIDEFIGDAILAVFGVPEKRNDDPFRAVACAIAMQNSLRELNEEIVNEGYPPLEMGIGINTGSVIVGNLGSEMRMKYGIVGATVNTAARIESNTIGGQVLIGESTYELVKDLVTTEPPQTAMMKGLRKPLVSFPVTAIGPPYDMQLIRRPYKEDGVEINLPFHCWKVEDKKIAGESMWGETTMLQENLIRASIDPPLEPLTDIKLIFDFCMEAHCFDDIYAKVIDLDRQKEKPTHHLSITSISQKDRKVVKKWISEAS